MAVDIVEIYRLLPKVDCGQCPAKSCLAFARAVSNDSVMLTACSRLTPDACMLIEALLCKGQ